MSVLFVDWFLRGICCLFFAGLAVWGAYIARGEWRDKCRFSMILYGIYSGYMAFLAILLLSTPTGYRERREGKLAPCPVCHQEYRPQGK